jgi:hypothetical protein
VSRRALQRNAADPKQVAFAERKARQAEELFIVSLQATMGSLEGRVVIWTLIARAGVYESIWDPSAKIHYNAGRQDYGHMLLHLVTEHCPREYLLMEQEARQRGGALDREAQAVQAAAEAQSNDDNS